MINERDGSNLVAHPDELPVGPWQRITVVTRESGQPRPYADSRYVYEITFEGGVPSTHPGLDFPHATQAPYRPPRRGREMLIPSPREEAARHETAIKAYCKALVPHPWTVERGEPRTLGDSYLDAFDPIEVEHTHTTYRVVVVTPFCD